MQNLKRLKPTTIIALDPYAAAFCEEVRLRLEREFGARGRLIQTCLLVNDGDSLRFESNLPAFADPSFNLQTSDGKSKRLTVEDAKSLFERDVQKIEPALIEMLGAGRSTDEIESALRDRINIVRERMIYLLLSAADPFANGVLLELTRFIRWLFATRFSQEIHTLQAVVLLPGLFAHADSSDYAAAYVLLKKLDYCTATELMITPQLKVPPFDGCWFMDGTNAQGDVVGTLAEKLDSYSDALAGFLMSDPERSGPPPGTLRGKPAAYSSFGHGELYYPATTVIRRLSSVLARDIIKTAFIGEREEQEDNSRKLLQASKQYVLGDKYTGTLNELELDDGAQIWKPFDPRVELEREGAARELLSELQRRHEEFKRKSLPGFQSALLNSSERVQRDLVAQLDGEIDRRADAEPYGLREARELLERLVDPNIELQADLLGDRPQNLTTELREAKASLDKQLGVTVDNSRTKALLDQISTARGRLTALEMSLRLTSAQVTDDQRVEQAEPLSETKKESDDDTSEEESTATKLRTSQEERQNLLHEIEEVRLQIQNSSGEYVRALVDEDLAADQMRRNAQQATREAKTEAVTKAETEVSTLGDSLFEAKRVLDDLAQEQREFVKRHFIIYPVVGLVLFLLPGLGALLGLGPALMLVGLFWENLFGFLLGIVVVVALYMAQTLFRFLTGIHRRVNEARERVKTLEQSLKYAVLQLRRARNEQLKLEYDLYVQLMRVTTVDKLIKTVRQRMTELDETLQSLMESHVEFNRLYEEAVPSFSAMRRPVLTSAAIDAYYPKAVGDVRQEAGIFVKESVSRSQLRRMPIEEFHAKLEAFTQERFSRLSQLSIEQVLLRQPDLITEEQAVRQLRELDNVAQPLMRLREIDAGDDQIAQRDTTLWAGAEGRDQLLQYYQRISPKASIRSSNDEQSLRALTRILNFPIYLLSQIDYYRDCYERNGAQMPDIPHPIPEELISSPVVRQAHKQLLLAIAVGLVAKGADGEYSLANGQGYMLGNSRRDIAEKLANDYGSQKVYAELSAQLQERLRDNAAALQHITKFLDSASDLESSERETLSTWARENDPSRLV